MTDDEMEILLEEFFRFKGGVVTDRQLDEMTDILKRHFPYPEQTSLNQARMVLGLPIPEGKERG